MSPQELAAIVRRDGQWVDPGRPYPGLSAAAADRRALLALLRETREALDDLHAYTYGLLIGQDWLFAGFKDKVQPIIDTLPKR